MIAVRDFVIIAALSLRRRGGMSSRPTPFKLFQDDTFCHFSELKYRVTMRHR